ncbi:ATP-dependent Clp protease adapter ClpS [Edwardsiella piscicida]|uniref:ATP-dependent Clp protease adapter protein ClpS n=3 Tax=Edwardsiella TaxID=635 RepID=A0A0H3DRV7_EDWTF|nr:ATP-dependent Clp protease adapter ClpS [Edwardsiella piscicida]ACY85043.1 ATP-dependent Clp protease adaptor protein [Edwardsiella tarda EIB202]ADM42105.1 ATP-dependent Clp protease adaptor protein ClpS [Edwardsiella tarda FL6-60]AGH74217.1 ATP-dependent Clp protease adaptor protein ClpS [Edwardsiella piscicida C07-087]AOP43434.1 ATP-dependent Clp protease adapter ClpS [Edwardsiella piscicida]ARD19517.1 ATP-dependent Clp protease adaptor ClpS [Edwardsiella piscicida]
MANVNDWLNLEPLVEDRTRRAVKPPSLYSVILNNDDYTPMEFVIEVLQKFFAYDIERATQLMLTVHYKGKAVCGVFTAEVAETKVALINRYARDNEHPLLCTLEKA